MVVLKGRTLHRHTAGPRVSTKFLHHSARSLRRTISLLSMFPAVAGVQPETSRSIKPRERDLGDLRLFFLVRILTRPTNHPRHAACASNNESKPVRPRFLENKVITSSSRASKPQIARYARNPKSQARLSWTGSRWRVPNPRESSKSKIANYKKRSSTATGASMAQPAYALRLRRGRRFNGNHHSIPPPPRLRRGRHSIAL